MESVLVPAPIDGRARVAVAAPSNRPRRWIMIVFLPCRHSGGHGVSIAETGSAGYISVGRPRMIFTLERRVLSSSRRSLEPRVGLVGLRTGGGGTAASRISVI